MIPLQILFLVSVWIDISVGDFTKIDLTAGQHINANEATRVKFNHEIFDSEHHYHVDERTIDITKEAGYRIEGHATFTGVGAHEAEVKLVEIKDGQKNVLDVCHTYDTGVRRNRCKLLATTHLKTGEKIFMEVKAAREAVVSDFDTYMFIAEMHKDY